MFIEIERKLLLPLVNDFNKILVSFEPIKNGFILAISESTTVTYEKGIYSFFILLTLVLVVKIATIVKNKCHLTELVENVGIVKLKILHNLVVDFLKLRWWDCLEHGKEIIWAPFVKESFWLDLRIHCSQEVRISQPR